MVFVSATYIHYSLFLCYYWALIDITVSATSLQEIVDGKPVTIFVEKDDFKIDFTE